MEDSKNDSSSEDKDDINPPPITKLPPPDPFDTRKLKQGRNAFDKKQSKKKKKKRRHPLDKYQDTRRKKGGLGCCLGVVCLTLVFLVALGAGGFWLAKPFLSGFTLVWSSEPDITITEAPDKPTVYLFPLASVRYEVPNTSVPLGIFGKSIHFSGDYTDNLFLRGIEVSAQSGTRCAKDLNIYAYQYNNNGVSVMGSTIGKTMR